MEASIGMIGPAMASVTTFGLLFACGYSFTTILAVVPFLILAIGSLPVLLAALLLFDTLTWRFIFDGYAARSKCLF